MERLLSWSREDDSLLSVLCLIGPGHLNQEVVVDIKLLVDTVEEGFTEWSPLEIGDGAV